MRPAYGQKEGHCKENLFQGLRAITVHANVSGETQNKSFGGPRYLFVMIAAPHRYLTF